MLSISIPKIFLAIPCHSGMVGASTMASVVQSINEGRDRFEIKLKCISGDADIARARNAMVAMFLQSNCTHMLFVDADISWGPGTLSRMMEHRPDFVAGAYRMRTDDYEQYPLVWPQQKRMEIDPETKLPLLEVDAIAGGFWRLTRSCLEQMVEARKGHYFSDPIYPGLRVPWLFDFVYDEASRVRRSEDLSFCRLWKSIGGQVWVDPAVSLDHTGLKAFRGNLGSALEVEYEQHQMRKLAAFRT